MIASNENNVNILPREYVCNINKTAIYNYLVRYIALHTNNKSIRWARTFFKLLLAF